MTRFLLTSLLLLGTPFAVETAPAVAADQAASVDIPAVLGTSDLARGGGTDGASWLVEVTTYEDSEVSLERALQVKARGGDALVEFVEPRKVKGQRLLTVGYNMWFTKPGLSKPVPISPRQRLAGSASNADLAATRYAEDFDATLLREEAVGSEDCYVFELTAASKRSTYDRIVYWVSKDRTLGLKAEYYTSSGKLFKSATFVYDNVVHDGSKDRPFISEILIQDEIKTAEKTRLVFSEASLGAVSPALFNLNLLTP
jgi:outer membrane lipoprotein-sorting protein